MFGVLNLSYCIKCGKELLSEAKYCSECGTSVSRKSVEETFEAAGEDMIKKVKALMHEANVRRIIIRDPQGRTVMEVPCSVGAIGAVFVPLLAALSALAALALKYTIIVERKE